MVKCFTLKGGKRAGAVVCQGSKGAKKNYDDRKVKISTRKGTQPKKPRELKTARAKLTKPELKALLRRNGYTQAQLDNKTKRELLRLPPTRRLKDIQEKEKAKKKSKMDINTFMGKKPTGGGAKKPAKKPVAKKPAKKPVAKKPAKKIIPFEEWVDSRNNPMGEEEEEQIGMEIMDDLYPGREWDSLTDKQQERVRLRSNREVERQQKRLYQEWKRNSKKAPASTGGGAKEGGSVIWDDAPNGKTKHYLKLNTWYDMSYVDGDQIVPMKFTKSLGDNKYNIVVFDSFSANLDENPLKKGVIDLKNKRITGDVKQTSMRDYVPLVGFAPHTLAQYKAYKKKRKTDIMAVGYTQKNYKNENLRNDLPIGVYQRLKRPLPTSPK
jgi:hypothetical protein